MILDAGLLSRLEWLQIFRMPVMLIFCLSIFVSAATPGLITLLGDCGWDLLSYLVILDVGLLSRLEWLQTSRMPDILIFCLSCLCCNSSRVLSPDVILCG